MFLKLFLLSLSVSVLCQQENVTYFCIVDGNGPGLTVSEIGKGKDDNLIDKLSNFLDNSTEPFSFNVKEKWKKFSSLDDKAKFYQPVLDQRWENFTNNKNDPKRVSMVVKRNDTTIFFSMKSTSNKSEWHLLLKKNDSNLYSCDANYTLIGNSEEFFTNSSSAVWKTHNYIFLYNNQTNQNETTEEIYKKEENCTRIQEGCITFHLWMCENCSMSFLFQRNDISGNNEKKIFNESGNGTWVTIQRDLNNFTTCFNIRVSKMAKNDTENVFWAISDIGYVSKKLSCQDNKRFIAVEMTKNISQFVCESATNQIMNFTTELPVFEKKVVNATEEKVEIVEKEEKEDDPPETATSSNLYLIIVPIVVIVILIGLIAFFIYKKKLIFKNLSGTSVRFTPESENLLNNSPHLVKDTNKNFPPIKRNEFVDYIERVFDPNGTPNELNTQFSALPSGYLKKHSEGEKTENVEKNRFAKIVPYDENRIILEKNLGDDHQTDYINASYVEGFNSPKEYIVTQNPLKNTAVDFWRMIWQEKVEHIIMTSNKDDNAYCYWPNLKKTEMYGGVEIYLEEDKMYEFYSRRDLLLRRYGENRKITQFHFHAWSKEMISPHIFIHFMNRLLAIPHQSAPVVFHCSAGVGRSATIILCDIALRAVAITGSYDFFNSTKKLRECRVDMIQNLKQYQLAHLIILEVMNFRELGIDLDEDCEATFSRYFEGNFVKKLWSEHLENRDWTNEVLSPSVVCSKYPKQNRYPDSNLLPMEHSRVKLQYMKPDYIHAMYVNDYKQMKNFIVAQQPLKNTLSNFWFMVLQNSVTTIVNLNEFDDSHGDLIFFPTSTMKIQDNILITLQSEEQHMYYDKLQYKVDILQQKTTRQVTVIGVKNWPKVKAVPGSTDVLISLWNVIKKSENNFPILICCDDGVRSSGLVACFFYMAEKMVCEGKCDIVGAVKAVRRTHSNFINFEQFVFLYHCAVAFYKNCLRK